MAVKGNNIGGNQDQQDQNTMSGAFASAQQQTPRGNEVPRGAFSYRTMGNIARSAMGRTQASEALSKMGKALADLYTANSDKTFEVNLIPLDMNSNVQLNVSVLVITLRDKTAMDLGVAYHTLLLGASIEVPQPRFEVINGINTEVLRSVGDAYDKGLIDIVKEAVTRAYPQSRLLPAGACEVPRDFNIADETTLYNLASNALFACSSELETSSPNFVDLNLANAQNDSNLTVRVSYGNQQTVNAVGAPIRSDIVIDFSAAAQGAQQNNQQQVERVTPVSRITGFVDLVWDPVVVPQNIYQVQQQNNFQRYSARFIATSLESTHLLTIHAQLLAMLPGMTLRENNNWVHSFRNESFSGGLDAKDIGAIGLEVNFENNANGVGDRIPTKSDSFKPEHLHKLIAATVKPGLIFSMDVPECGPDTWYNDVFAAAAEGNQKATQAIINAANCLTNGIFSKYFGGGPVAIDEYNRIHLGYYIDSTGVKRDIREIDYLAVLNHVGDKDPSVIRDWSDSFLKTNYDLRLRLAGRKKVITGIHSNVVFTGFARRVTLETSFTNAFAKAAVEAGLNIRSVSTYNDIGSYERATAGFASSTLMPGDSTGLFNRGGMFSNVPGQGTQRSFNSRW